MCSGIACANPEKAYQSAPVEAALQGAIARGPGSVISLDSLGPRGWTLAYVFGPYTSRDAMRRCLATSEFEDYNLDRRDDAYALYFKSPAGGGQIWSVLLPRSRVEFSALAVGREYLRDSARFVARRAPATPRTELFPAAGPGRGCY